MKLIFAGIVLVVCGGVILISTVFGDTTATQIEPVRIGKPESREAREGRAQRTDRRDRSRQPQRQGRRHGDGSAADTPAVVAPAPAGTEPTVPSGGGASDDSGGDDGDVGVDGSPQPGPSPSQPAPQPEPAPAPSPSPVPTDDDDHDADDAGESADD